MINIIVEEKEGASSEEGAQESKLHVREVMPKRVARGGP